VVTSVILAIETLPDSALTQNTLYLIYDSYHEELKTFLPKTQLTYAKTKPTVNSTIKR